MRLWIIRLLLGWRSWKRGGGGDGKDKENDKHKKGKKDGKKDSSKSDSKGL
jgi:hypothetical protein